MGDQIRIKFKAVGSTPKGAIENAHSVVENAMGGPGEYFFQIGQFEEEEGELIIADGSILQQVTAWSAECFVSYNLPSGVRAVDHPKPPT